MLEKYLPEAAGSRQIFLAPMEGLLDAPMRDVLTRISTYDFVVTPFIRISSAHMPWKCFKSLCPELQNNNKTPVGTPVIIQLLGKDPVALGRSAAHLARLSPIGIDLNFGCPAPLVNRHGCGAALLSEPEKIAQIVREVRKNIPSSILFSAKMRLGITDTSYAIACAQAIEAGGVDHLIVHARTRTDRYKFPVRWEWIASIREALQIPVIANGDINSVEAYNQCLDQTGCSTVMIGRHAVSDPFLVRHIRQGYVPRDDRRESEWQELTPYIAAYWQQIKIKVQPRHAPGRLKLWLSYLRQRFLQAELLYEKLRPITRLEDIEKMMNRLGILV